jgi:hypothetical protein
MCGSDVWYVFRTVRLLHQPGKEDKAKIEWLRSAVKEGNDDIERSEYITLRSRQDIKEFVRNAGEQAALELRAERSRT